MAELSRLMRAYGISTPTAADYGGTGMPTAPASDASAEDKAAFDEAMRKYNLDQQAYNAYRTEYSNRLASGSIYNQPQFQTDRSKPFVPQYASPLTNPTYGAVPINVNPQQQADEYRKQVAAGYTPNDILAATTKANKMAPPEAGWGQMLSTAYPDQAKMVESAYSGMGRTGFGTGANQIDMPGYNYWVNQLASGKISPDQFSAAFAAGAQGAAPAQTFASLYEKYVPKPATAATSTPTQGGAAEYNTVNDLGGMRRGGAVRGYQHGGNVRGYQQGGPTITQVDNPFEANATVPAPVQPEPNTLPDTVVTAPREVAAPRPASRSADTIEQMLERYLPRSQGYESELAAARARSRTESEAFARMMQNMISNPESDRASKAEMYFRLAAAFGAPTRTGSFGETLSNVGTQLAEHSRGARTTAAERQRLLMENQRARMAEANQDVTTIRTLAGQEMRDRAAVARELLQERARQNQPNERERRINDIMSTHSIDRQTASNIVDGIVTVTPDPVTGVPTLVNKITGQQVRAGSAIPSTAPAPAPAVPAVTPQSSGEAPAAETTAAAPTTTAAPTAAGIPPTTRPETAAIQSERPRPTLWQMADVTGALPAARAALQGVTGQLGIDTAPPGLIEERQYFSTAQGNMISALGNNGSYISKPELDLIRQEVSIEPNAFTDPRSLRERMRSIDNSLRIRLHDAIRTRDDPNKSREVRRDADRSIGPIQSFLEQLGVPARTGTTGARARQDNENRATPSLPRIGEVREGYRFLGGNPGDRNSWERE